MPALDRAFILRAHTAMLRHDESAGRVAAFDEKYAVTVEERLLTQRVAVMLAMQDVAKNPSVAVARVRTLAQRFNFTDDMLKACAWEVVRGDIEDDQGGLFTWEILRNFLREEVMSGASFPSSGEISAFKLPEGEEGERSNFIEHLDAYKLADPPFEDWEADDEFPAELLELLRFMGLVK